MSKTRLVLIFWLIHSIVSGVVSIKDPNAGISRTIDNDICRLVSNGLIDTTYNGPEGTKDYLIFKDDYYWCLTNDLKQLDDRIYKKIQTKFEANELHHIDMAFAVISGGWFSSNINSYFIKLKSHTWYRYDDNLASVNEFFTFNLTDEAVLQSSAAFRMYHDDTDCMVVFIRQNRINDSYVERNYTYYDYEDYENPKLSTLDKLDVPNFIKNLDSKYWIKGVLEIEEGIGMLFLEYNTTGFHCYFDPSNDSKCANGEIIPNMKLFGCRDPEPIPDLIITDLETTSATTIKPETNSLINYIFGPVYKIVVIILVVIIVILFLTLPFFWTFKRLFKCNENSVP